MTNEPSLIRIHSLIFAFVHCFEDYPLFYYSNCLYRVNMKPFTLATLATALLSNQAAALPALDPDTPIPLNAFKFNARDGQDPHMGIDPELIRKFASQAPPNLGKRVIDFDPKKQLVDG